MKTIRALSTQFLVAIFVLAATVFTQSSAHAYDLQPFQKRFQFVRNDAGEVQYVRDLSIVTKFSIRTYIRFVKETLQNEQKLMNQKSDYNYQIEELFGSQTQNFSTGNNKSANDSQIIIDSLRQLQTIDFDQVFNNPKFKEIISNFELKMGDALLSLDPTIMAHLTNKNFFYKKRVTYQVVTWALNFAKRKLSSVPVLNTVSYVITKVEEMIRQRRIYHQNMLLHYLQNFPEAELGLTHMEVNHMMSSIYESRIEWYAFWESKKAKTYWDQYGTDLFFTSIRGYNNRLRRMGSIYPSQSLGQRINFGYQIANLDAGKVILDLANTSHMFSPKLSIAYYYDSPNKVKRMRGVAQMAQLGLSFLRMGSFFKGIFHNYLDSLYRQQTLSEGALFGYFESHGDNEFTSVLKKQVLNPFETL